MTDEADYPAWPSEPIPATLGPDWLHFYGPDGERAAVPISPAGGQQAGNGLPWACQDNGDGTVTVSPSIHAIGRWHSPNPAVFRLVDELVDPKG